MADDTGGRTFREKEIGEVIRRASELQKEEIDSFGSGLSLDELEKIAEQAGIDPKYIRQAATELSKKGALEKIGIAGVPLRLELVDAIDGQITDEQWHRMVQEIRRAFGQNGSASQIGKSLEWSGNSNELVEGHVAFSPEENRTRIEISQRNDEAAVLVFLVTTVFTGIGAFIFLANNASWPGLLEWIVAGGGIAGIFASARMVFARWTRKEQKKLQDLMKRLKKVSQEKRQSHEQQSSEEKRVIDSAERNFET